MVTTAREAVVKIYFTVLMFLMYFFVKVFSRRSASAEAGSNARLRYCCRSFRFSVGISAMRISFVTLKT